MIAQFLGKIFGTKNTREIKRLKKIVDRISALESGLETLSDQDIRAKREDSSLGTRLVNRSMRFFRRHLLSFVRPVRGRSVCGSSMFR